MLPNRSGYPFSLKVKWGYISVQKLESEPSKCFAVCISLQTKAIKVSLGFPGLENVPEVPGRRPEVDQNHDARNAVSATVLVLKWSGAKFRPTGSKVSVQKALLCPFQCKRRPSGVTLESPGLVNIPKVAWKRAKLGLTHDAREAVSATISVWKWGGILFRPTS